MPGRKTPAGVVLTNDVDVCQYLLEAAQVAVVPGSAFGLEGYFRISFATSTVLLEQACARIKAACEQLA